ncbi:UDP-4-amino-4,6-dideoxy-N-acetyl-beta-L-altrosamine transaminase [Emticicia sp. 21SJ11W-3]|uniref:UDP-4-amino-4, 6-dideoxy-N-acetyl-beta-L-altrosamine transaminase n=1 Tax=Emticicia sp. 21SJ11W-3 TaxID=2916755 RepID=UPI00209E45E2|nr:UDP-4-amino-4,6-dideoxy-N-acetyl-beta-L-altrosamine transaminase [Emticicia sp. 21SJ11W-3]UTA68405.1 UDP-4-amino-4,6-dideoxy-N-acetyl-beta-L-altrosamine transaminase [Emticicia sp. 21SJ11W-3]
MNVIPYGKQHITEEDIAVVIETLKSPYLTQGPKIKEFEDNFARFIGARYAVAVSNGTAALHLCTLALGVKEGQKVIATPITFVASSNCVRYCGGEIVFGDIDPETYLLDINAVRALLENAPEGTYTGIIPVDFAGRAVNMEEFRKLADEYNLWIIEDACHAPGGFFKDSKGVNQYCGNGNFADLAVFSFHPVKHIACGEGGMITTNDEELYKKLLQLRTHGIVRDTNLYTNSIELAGGADAYPGWYMEMQSLGYNYRITDFQAALGSSQLQRIDHNLASRRAIAARYDAAFRDCPFIKGHSGVVEGHAYHLYVIEVDNRLGLYNHLHAHNIMAQIHYVPSHIMPYYRDLGWKEGDRPMAEAYYKRCLSIPMYHTLTTDEQNFVIDSILNFLNTQP